jgi:hypothetical protein
LVTILLVEAVGAGVVVGGGGGPPNDFSANNNPKSSNNEPAPINFFIQSNDIKLFLCHPKLPLESLCLLFITHCKT